ncbi:MAG TPA: 6-pyruvoyl-tetrahydropterin synthase-related protein [Terracidiphilus sp.]
MSGMDQGHKGNGGQEIPRTRRWMGPLYIALTAALAVLPQIIRGTSCGHDFDFHLVSWIDALASWRHGIFYPHWATTPNYNAGEPRFVFYPPLTWMLGAALGAVLPWIWVPPAMTFLLLTGTGLATRALARQALPLGAATLAGCIAIFSGYTLYSVYERSAFAELAGGIWIPLLLLLVLRQGEQGNFWARIFDSSAAGLTLVIAASWLSNAPLGVMACYLLAAFAVAVSATRRTCVPVLRAFFGATVGLALAAFYLLPAAAEQKWVDIRQATEDPGEKIQNSFLFGHHADPQLALHDAELHRVSWIATGMLLAIAVALLLAWRRRALPGGRTWWLPLALIPAAVLVLQLPLSLPLWDLLPKMRFLQFPWRWLVVLTAPLGIFLAAAMWPAERARRNLVIGVSALGFVGLAVFAGRTFFEACDQYDAIPGMLEDYHAGDGFQGTDEYAPARADNSLVASNLPAGCLVHDPKQQLGKSSPDDAQPSWAAKQGSCVTAIAEPARADARHWSARGQMPAPGYLVLRLRRYPAWDVTLNGRHATDLGSREDGLIVLPVSAGPVAIDADWQSTPDATRGRWISLGAAALLLALCALTRRRSRARIK